MSAFLEGLNDAQRQAVAHTDGPLLIVAGAGTGKTTVLARRYARLLMEEGLRSDQIVMLTFTEKAAHEMEERVLQLIPNGTYDFWISTFHGFCQRILERYALEIGLPHHFRLVNELDAWMLLRRHLDRLPLDHYRPLANPTKFLSALLQHISRAKDEGVTAERYAAFVQDAVLDGDSEIVEAERKRLQEIADCYATYQRILREEGCLDFGDLILETLRVLRERPAVLRTLHAQFAMIMVDEFQDTNWAQYELVKRLCGERGNVTVVGDDDQAIYKFRGASLANILQFQTDFPAATPVALTHNYRSKQEILDQAYGFIQKNDPNRLETRLRAQNLSKRLEAIRGDGGTVEGCWYQTLDQEAEAVAERIETLKAQHADLSWNDIAILTRSNESAVPFAHALELRGIPFRFYALRGLYTKPLIIDLMALMSLCEGAHDSSFVWRVMGMSCMGFSSRDMAEIVHYANRKGISLWTTLQQIAMLREVSDEGKRSAGQLIHVVGILADAAKRQPPLAVFHLAVEKSESLAAIMTLPEQEKLEQLGLLQSFMQRIKRYEAMAHAPTLKEFLEEIRLEIQQGDEGVLGADPDAGPELVKVMTIHASKGLEFRYVFVTSMVDQRFPTRERSDALTLPDGLVAERLAQDSAHLEEERRLFYVALTRAKDGIVLTGAANYGGSRAKKPSIFFEEANIPLQKIVRESALLSSLNRSVEMEEELAYEQQLYPLKRRFSFTQLAAFRTCPLQYKFAHIYRIPVFGSPHKSFGQSIHRTFFRILRTHLERGQAAQGKLFGGDAPSVPRTGFRLDMEEALAVYEAEWIDEWFADRKEHDKYKTRGREMVKRMFALWQTSPPEVHALEFPFEWRIGDRSLKGTIDRMDRHPDGGYVILDYKTGEAKSEDRLSSEDKEQLRIYQLAMEEKGLSVKGLAYVYPLTGETVPVDILQGEEREEFRRVMKERMDAILTSTFPPHPSPFICKHCDFRKICQYSKF